MQATRARPEANRRNRGDFPAQQPYLHALICYWHRSRLLLKAFTLAGIVSMLAACGGGGPASMDSSVQQTSSRISQLTVSPRSIAFGSVKAKTTSAQAVVLENTGNVSVTVSRASVEGNGFNLNGLSLPLILTAGQKASFSATFSPTDAGDASGSISLASDASNSPSTIALSGTASIEALSANPTSLSFGNVTLGSNSVLPVVVTNTGNTSITISGAAATGAGFSISGPALPLTVAAGQNTSFSVTFAPTAAGSVTGNLSIASSAANSPTGVSLSATGAGKHSVTLSWAPSATSSVKGYNVYRGTISGGPYAKLDSSPVAGTNYTDAAVEAGETYYYVTTALDSQDNESARSNEAAAVIPSP